MPDVEEFGKEELLGYEKEVLGIYLSGHPLENYRGMMEKTISAKTSDFQQDEETNLPKVMDGQKVIIGGMITDKTIKYTKNNKVMAFLTVEDLVGTVEVVVFPRDYEKSQQFLNEEGRVFIQGRVSAEDDRASKLILEKSVPLTICQGKSGYSLTIKKATHSNLRNCLQTSDVHRVTVLL